MSTETDIAYDAIIAGAGPAGCMAALHAPPQAKILLIDARNLPRDVICGGVLSSWSMRQLASCGPLPESVFSEPKVIGWTLFDWDMARQGGIRGDTYFNVNRKRFDEWLLEKAAARRGVEVWPSTRFMSAQAAGGGLRVQLRRAGAELQVAARSLIGADGATSAVRRFVALPDTPDYWVTVQETIRSEGAGVDRFFAFLCEQVDFYGWVIPKDDELLVGAGYDRSAGRHIDRFREFKSHLRRRHGVWGSTVQKPRARPALRLRRPGEIRLTAGNIMLAGEAAGLICPWSGEGIAYALYSGTAAGKALGASSPAYAYRKSVRKLAPRLLLDIAGRKVMKRQSSRLLAAALVPKARYRSLRTQGLG